MCISMKSIFRNVVALKMMSHFVQILGGCTNSNKLVVAIESNHRCTAVAAFLRNPATALRSLSVHFKTFDRSHFDNEDWRRLDVVQAVADISASLVLETLN